MFVVRRESMFPLLCLWWNALAISLESVRLSLYVVCITKDLIEWYFKRTISNCSTFQIATPKLQETCQELSLNKGTAGELRKYLLDRTKLCLEIESAHNLVFIEMSTGSLWIPWETWLPLLVRARLAMKEIQAFQPPKLWKDVEVGQVYLALDPVGGSYLFNSYASQSHRVLLCPSQCDVGLWSSPSVLAILWVLLPPMPAPLCLTDSPAILHFN